MEIKSLFGITIGPIREVLQASQKTRELWSGSLLFSLMMEHIYREIKKWGGIEIYSPFFDIDNNVILRAGLLPDLLICGSDRDTAELKELVETLDKSAIQVLVNWAVADDPKIAPEVYDRLFGDYIYVDYIILPANDIEKKEYISTVMNYLNAVDLSRNFTPGPVEDTCQRCHNLPGKYTFKDKFNKNKEQRICPLCLLKLKSINNPDFSARLSEKYKKGFETVDEIARADGAPEMKYHNYAAILTADGDDMGKIAREFGADITGLSEKLFSFGCRAVDLIEDFQAVPVYLGGDDVLAMTPLAVRTENGELKTVLHLAEEISSAFCNIVQKKQVTGKLSAGITVFYCKSPLSFALSEAFGALSTAKSVKGKNRLHVKFIQHSGTVTEFGVAFSKSDKIMNILGDVVSGKMKLPESISYNLRRFEKLMCLIPDAERLRDFFNNNFNEDVHKNISLPETLMSVFEAFGFNEAAPDGNNSNGRSIRRRIIGEILSFLKICKMLRSE